MHKKAEPKAIDWQDWMWERRAHDPLVAVTAFNEAANPQHSTLSLRTRKGLALEASDHDLKTLIDACTDDALGQHNGSTESFTLNATQNLLQATAARRMLAGHIQASEIVQSLQSEGESCSPAAAFETVLRLQQIQALPPAPVRAAQASLASVWQTAQLMTRHRLPLRRRRARPTGGPEGDALNG